MLGNRRALCAQRVNVVSSSASLAWIQNNRDCSLRGNRGTTCLFRQLGLGLGDRRHFGC
uniref:Uncharacterized protein n=1 Tax=Hyaloperonospora arabidopsidis (strain Emoy2) TaxID=559515 RepID=M4BG47_HYAAE